MAIVGYKKPSRLKQIERMKPVIRRDAQGRDMLVGFKRKSSSKKRGGLTLRHPRDVTRKAPPEPVSPPEPVEPEVK